MLWDRDLVVPQGGTSIYFSASTSGTSYADRDTRPVRINELSADNMLVTLYCTGNGWFRLHDVDSATDGPEVQFTSNGFKTAMLQVNSGWYGSTRNIALRAKATSGTISFSNKALAMNLRWSD